MNNQLITPTMNIYMIRYDGLTIYLNVWDRNGLLSDGEKFVGTVLQILKSNQCFVRDTTMINVTADYSRDIVIFNGVQKATFDPGWYED